MWPDLIAAIGNIFSSLPSFAGTMWNDIKAPFSAPSSGGSFTPAPGGATAFPSVTPDQQIANVSGAIAGPGPVSVPGSNVPATIPPTAQGDASMSDTLGASDIVKGLVSFALKNPTMIPNLIQAYQRYQLGQTLSDPNAIMAGANKFMTLPAGLKERIGRQTDAMAAERGLGGAPGLWREAYSEALAPYEYQARQQAIQDYIRSLLASSEVYPMGGPLGEFSNLLTEIQTQRGNS